MSRLGSLQAASAVLTVCLLPWPAAGQQSALKINADPGTYDWVVQEETARIFASSATKNEIVEYDPVTGKEVRRFPVGGEPSELIIKRHWLVAGCKKSTTLDVIDLKRNQVAGSVQLEGKGPYALFCSQAENPYGYAICNSGDWSKATVYQVDLEKLKIRKQTPVGFVHGWRQNKPLHVAMSRDGKWIVLDARGLVMPSGANLMLVEEQRCVFEEVRNHHKTFGQLSADPHSRDWAFGDLLYPLDITAEISKFSGAPVAIHPHWNLAASLKMQTPRERIPATLYLDTFTHAKLQTTLELGEFQLGNVVPGQGRNQSATPLTGVHDPNVQFAGDRVVCGYGATAYVVDLTKIDVALKPRLVLAGSSVANVLVGKPLHMDLSAKNPKLTGPVSYKIVSAPEGVAIQDGMLSWTPDATALGAHEVTVEGSCGEATDRLTMHINVGVPQVDLTFRPIRVAADRQGKFAVAWGPKWTDQTSQLPVSSVRGPMDFAVIDLDRAKIVAKQSLTASIRLMHLDEKYVYLAPDTGNLLYRLDRDDPSQRARTFLNGSLSKLVSLPDGHVAVTVHSQSRGEIQVFDRETLKPDPNHPAARPMLIGSRTPGDLMVEAGNGTSVYYDRIVDAKTGETLCFVGHGQLPLLIQPKVRFTGTIPIAGNARDTGPELWGRALRGNSLVNDQGTTVATISGYAATICSQLPALVSLRTESGDHTRKLYLEVRELVLGTIVESSLIAGGGPKGNISDSELRLFLAQDKVLVPERQQLLIHTLPQELAAKLPQPLHLDYPLVPIASVDKPLALQLTSGGGKGERRYSLLDEYSGLSLDPATGKVEIDLPALWARYLTSYQPKPGPPFNSPSQRQLAPGDAYRQLTGETLPAGKIGVVAPLHVAVSDREGQQDRLSLVVVALAPDAEINQMEAARQEAARLAQEKGRAEVERLREEREKQRAPGTGGPNAERIDQLEDRIRLLETTLNAILQKVDKLDPQPPPQPQP